jgi:GDSL-like Lipase/Acylhydrolase family
MRRAATTLLAGVLAMGACSACGSDDNGAALAVFGDSLTFAARDYLEQDAKDAGVPINVVGYPGAAPCDQRQQMELLLDAEPPPTALVLVYAGNNITRCAGGRTGAALADAYAEDARAVVAKAQARHVPVVLAGPPALEPPAWAENGELINDRFRAIADDEDGVDYLDLSQILSPDGYTATLPCLNSEGPEQGCVDGMITVRRDDGIHFDDPGPDGYSSGSYRFAQAVFDAGEAAAG